MTSYLRCSATVDCPPRWCVQANETFAFVGNVTRYTRMWLNISAQLRTFLEEGRLHHQLLWLQQVGGRHGDSSTRRGVMRVAPSSLLLCPQLWSGFQQHPELLSSSDRELMQRLLEANYSLPNTSTLLEQLDTIDNAACGWTRFMSKVGL